MSASPLLLPPPKKTKTKKEREEESDREKCKSRRGRKGHTKEHNRLFSSRWEKFIRESFTGVFMKSSAMYKGWGGTADAQ